MTEDTAAPFAGLGNQNQVHPARPGADGIRDLVTVRLPAASAYLSVLRTATAGLAARLDFNLDEMDDLRIAIDEACAMLLSQAIPGTDLTCEFEIVGRTIQFSASVSSAHAVIPPRGGFAWTVLSTLAEDVDARTSEDGTVTISLRKSRSAPGSV